MFIFFQDTTVFESDVYVSYSQSLRSVDIIWRAGNRLGVVGGGEVKDTSELTGLEGRVQRSYAFEREDIPRGEKYCLKITYPCGVTPAPSPKHLHILLNPPFSSSDSQLIISLQQSEYRLK